MGNLLHGINLNVMKILVIISLLLPVVAGFYRVAVGIIPWLYKN